MLDLEKKMKKIVIQRRSSDMNESNINKSYSNEIDMIIKNKAKECKLYKQIRR